MRMTEEKYAKHCNPSCRLRLTAKIHFNFPSRLPLIHAHRQIVPKKTTRVSFERAQNISAASKPEKCSVHR